MEEGLHPLACDDALELIAGEFIGEGKSRMVFEHAQSSKYVLKVAKDDDAEDGNWGVQQNILEWHNWCELGDKKIGQCWLAPCRNLSKNGVILVQRKIMPLRKGEKIPKVPALFKNDVKREHFGWIQEDGKKKLVYVDYAYLNQTYDETLVDAFKD